MAVQISGNDITVPRDGTFTRNVTIGGTLTYEDVTNIDSVGLVTARNGIEIGARPGVAASISVDGDMVVSGVSTFSSDVIFNADARIVDSIIHEGDTNTKIRFPAADTITVETGGSEAFRVDSSQRLLLGTTSVGNASAYYDNLVISNTTSGEGAGITLFAATNGYNAIDFGDTAVGRGRITYYHDDDRMMIDVAGGEAFRIDSSKRLLLGTTSVGSKSAGSPLQIQTSNSGAFAVTIKNRTSNNDYSFIGFTDADADEDLVQIGVQRTAANTGDIFFYTNGGNASSTEKVRIDSSGRLGIQGAPTKALLDVRASGGSATMLTAVFGANEGTTAGTLSDNTDKACRIGSYHYDIDEEPFGILVASGTNGTNNLTFGGGTSLMNAATEIKFNTAANSTTTSGTNRLIINSEGQIQKRQDPVNRTSLKTFTGEGLWIDHYQLQDSGTYRRYADIASIGDGSWGGVIRFLTMADSGSSVERLRITQNNIFTNSQTANAPSSGSAWGFTQDQLYLSTSGTSANYALRFYNDNGLVGSALVNGSSTTYNTSSDYRLKENQVSISDGITRLKQLKPYRFNFKADTSTTLDGFFAHEAQSVVPEAVTGTKDQVANADDVTDGLASAVGDAVYQGIDHSKFVPLLTAALQEAISEIETLKTEVAALKSQLNN